jgi:hypothetical protein
MKLNASEKKLLIKILENTVERFEPDDLIHMINGPKYRMVIDRIYDDCFRKYIKYDVSVLDESKQSSAKESEIVQAMWDKLYKYISEELGED